MKTPRLATVLLLQAILVTFIAATATAQVTKYVRYSNQGKVAWGLLEGDTIRELSGNIYESAKPTGRTVKLAAVKLLAPGEPSKVIAAGLNYKSHIGQQPAAKYVGLFAKMPTSIVGPDEEIAWHEGTENLHFEGELVVVIGRKASKVSRADAGTYIFGVTAGNDVSERNWQKSDLQWFRAKAADTYGPLGPVLVKGLNYDNLQLTTRLNGEVVQSERTNMLIFDIHTIVSYVSQYVTLLPGDLIYTGTPGQTKAMKPGDTIEVEIEGVGVLRNKIAGGKPTTSQ